VTAAALWSRLVAAGVAVGERPPAQEELAPWYVRLMLGLAGCIAAGFLIGFVGIGLYFVVESKAASIGTGLAMIGAAYALFLAARSDFSSMFGFAVSVAGQALLAVGIFRMFDTDRSTAPWAVMAVIEAILAVAMPNYLTRLASAFAAPVLLALGLAAHGANSLAAGLAAAGVAALWLNELRAVRYHAILAPIGYGLTLALVYIEAELGDTSLVGFFGGEGARWAKPWAGQVLVAAALIVTAGALLRRAGWILSHSRSALALLATAAIGAASFKAPGVAGGLMIVLLGFANGNRVLTGAGIAALLFYVSSYYYLLDATLLAKAGVLAVTGLALLAARWLLLNLVLPKGARDA
jgi:uncharacterized membrane protein